MKRITLTLLVVLIVTQFIHGQKIDSTTDRNPEELYDMYMQKRKANKTLAWVTLGAGLTMMTIGGAMQASQPILGDTPDKGVALFYVGTAVSVLSIPLFIASGSNKRKANLALKGESISLKYIPIEKSNYMSISLTIPLGK